MNLKELFADQTLNQDLQSQDNEGVSLTLEERKEGVAMILQGFRILTIKGGKGDKGDAGDQGEQGQSIVGPRGPQGLPSFIPGPRGLRGLLGKNGLNGKNGKDGVDGLDGRNGKNGKNGSPDTAQLIAKKLASLKGKDRLDVESLSGLDRLEYNFLSQAKSFVPRALGALYDVDLRGLDDGQTLVWESLLQKWIPGNAIGAIRSLIAGSNITITDDGLGNFTINALTSGGSSMEENIGIQTETPTGVVNGINTTFTVQNLPFEIIVDNQSFLVIAAALNGLVITGTGPYTITVPFAPNSWISSLYNILTFGQAPYTITVPFAPNSWIGDVYTIPGEDDDSLSSGVEIPTGVIDGSNTIFTATHLPFEVLVDNQSLLVSARLLNGLSVVGVANVGAEIPSGVIDGSNTTFTAINLPFQVVVDNQSFLVAAASLNGLSVTGTGPYTITVPFAPNSWIGDLYFNVATVIGTWTQGELVAGSGTSFTLAAAPLGASEHIFGQRNRLYPTSDFSISGALITTVLSYAASDLLADYFAGSFYTGYTDNELVTGSGTAFTLAATPTLGTERIYGQRRRLRSGTDYTISGASVTTVLSFSTGDILADYQTAVDSGNVTSEIVSGSGTAFTLANTPVGHIELYDPSGLRLYEGTDFSISGVNITTTLSYSAGDILADYRK